MGSRRGRGAQEIHRDTIEITGLASGGDGVGRATDGRVLFVPMTAPGDRVQVRITRRRKRHGFARLEAIEQAGAGRTTPRCELFGNCGGCEWQHLDRATQLHWKGELVRQVLRRIGKIELDQAPQVLEATGAYGFRTRARMPFHPDGRPGFYQRGSRRVVEVLACPILSPLLNELLAAIARPPWPCEELRLLSTPAQEAMLSLSLEPEFALPTDFHEQFEGWCEGLSTPQLCGGLAWQASARVAAWGAPWSEEGSVRYRPDGFAQASFEGNRVLIQQVLQWWADDPTPLVEVYAGRGNLTLPLGRSGRKILALESDPVAVQDGRAAAQGTSIRFVPFHDEREDLRQVCEAHGFPLSRLLVDPPRRGLSGELREQILAARPEQILYVSCDPATLARDLRELLDGGYLLQKLLCVDLTPQTAHVESMALLRLPSS